MKKQDVIEKLNDLLKGKKLNKDQKKAIKAAINKISKKRTNYALTIEILYNIIKYGVNLFLE